MAAVWRILSLMTGRFLFVMSAVFSFVVFGVLTFLHVFQRVASARLEPGGLA